MLPKEATWLKQNIETLATTDKEVFPLGNIGSSDEKQLQIQPWVYTELMEPLRKIGKVYNVDIKDSKDVDLCGDLLNPSFIEELKNVGLKSILCANILTNIESKEQFAKSIVNVIPKGGYIIVSVSNRFPYVADPVDTLYRPSLAELKALFPNTEIVEQSMIEGDTYFRFLRSNPRVLLTTLIRLCLPFYKFYNWKCLVQYFPNLFKPFRTSCLILQKC